MNSSLKGLCDFEKNGFCNWQNLKDADDFDWIINSGPTPTLYTGPTFDHTLANENGHYIYIDASYPAVKGWKAQLSSEPVLNDDNSCVSFWYHMFGKGIGTLNVYLVEGESQKVIWSLSGEAGDSWMQGLATFKSKSLHSLVFEGVVGDNDRGDIALDDLLIKTEPCQIQPESARPKINVPELVNCDFENQTFCNWRNEAGYTLEWTLGKGASEDSGRTGPKSGALGTTYYIYINSRKNTQGCLYKLN